MAKRCNFGPTEDSLKPQTGGYARDRRIMYRNGLVRAGIFTNLRCQKKNRHGMLSACPPWQRLETSLYNKIQTHLLQLYNVVLMLRFHRLGDLQSYGFPPLPR